METEKDKVGEAKLTMFDIAGPSMLWLWRAAVVYSVYAILLPFFAYQSLPIFIALGRFAVLPGARCECTERLDGLPWHDAEDSGSRPLSTRTKKTMPLTIFEALPRSGTTP